LRNFTDLAGALAETARVLRPGGRLAILEVDAPRSTLLRAGYDIWFKKIVPRLGGALSDREAYDYLPRSVAYLPSSPILRRMVADAGYSGVGIRPLAGGLSQLLFATRAGPPP
jgi:demethylmenaquinone methyltransferase/2-methoxy-6-polyprenyl-1,4-benzoquinol methylase